MMRSPRVTR